MIVLLLVLLVAVFSKDVRDGCRDRISAVYNHIHGLCIPDDYQGV